MAIPSSIRKLLEELSSEMQKAILKSIQDIKSRVVMKNLVSAIESGDVSAVLKTLNLSEEFFEPVAEALRKTYTVSGKLASAQLAKGFDKATRLGIIFNGRSVVAEEWIRLTASRVIADLINASNEAVRGIVINGLAEGKGARATAIRLVGRIEQGRRVGGVVGLNNLLTGYLETARAELNGLNMRNYLSRELRDKRFDVHVHRALHSGKSIAQAKIDQMLLSMSNRMLEYRALAIARTSTNPAVNASRHEAANQMIERGTIIETDIERRWRSAGDDGRTRESHLEMDDQRVIGLKDPFVTPDGVRLMHPGDDSLGAGPEEIINCRCYEEVNVDYLAARARLERTGG